MIKFIRKYAFDVFMLSVLIAIICGVYFHRNKPQSPVINGPQKYRYLQKCEEGITVEYISTSRIPVNVVCGGE